MAKLFVFAALLAFVAVAHATVAVTTYTDDACTTAVGHYQTTNLCILPTAKRAAAQASCSPVDGYNIFIKFDECTDTNAAPTTQIPAGWYGMKYTNANPTCDFSSVFESTFVAEKDVVTVLAILVPELGPFPVNVTVNCNNGVQDLFSCVPGMGCSSFEGVANNACSNITTTIAAQEYSGIQTSCVAAPTTGTPSGSAPTAGTPSGSAPSSNAPSKAPGKSSEAVSVVVASTLAVIATAATLLC